MYMMETSIQNILKKDIEKANGYIDHNRDFLFTYAGLRQVADKYLVQDRSTGQVYETPQVHVYDDRINNFRRIP